MCNKLTSEKKAIRILRNRQARVVASFRLEGIRPKAVPSDWRGKEPLTATQADQEIQRLIALHAR
jgi:hypothetical protein